MEKKWVIQELMDVQLLSFYGYWQLSVSLFAFVALMAIWWHIGKRQNDFGQVWLALSILCWSFSGGVEVFYASQFQQELLPVYKTFLADQNISNNTITKLQDTKSGLSHQLTGLRSILSLFNSLFILLALPWFRYLPKRIEPLVKSRNWQIIVGLPFVLSLLPTLSKFIFGKTTGFISEPDVYFAFLTLGFMGFVLWESFVKRRLQVLAWLSVICIFITIIAQLYKFSDSHINLTLFSAIFKTNLIMIFFALSLSWVKELAENIIPEPEQLFLKFKVEKTPDKKFQHLVLLSGMPGKDARTIPLTPALFNILLAFAKSKSAPENDWLEIKPKNEMRTQRQYDINDHNQIKRLIAAMLDGIFGKGSWTQNQHFAPLKKALFEMSEKRERKIRLRIPVENIALPEEP